MGGPGLDFETWTTHSCRARWDASASGLGVASLVDSREAVVPGEAIWIEQSPGATQTQRSDRKKQKPDAPAHGLTGWVLVLKGAQRYFRVAHSRSAIGILEEQVLIEHAEPCQYYAGSQHR